MAGSDVRRSMAKRAGVKITELDGSHVIIVLQPQAIADVILDVVRAVRSQAAGQARRVGSR